ncbi:hypothetical protein SLNWT_3025 [Streptomyces albus]|uniref:Uncharacterized protein n=1 Tax=Streptomyces albus (strain ATCC 21838 / DSM 41398 / FERM P-419 / JCM 4703 / NBRC 107858) TaxID=1081613 RepID=A0A0B5EXN2_STRA4|nr:hypothetical protein SLNWT_3025 [Streptomyces albus]
MFHSDSNRQLMEHWLRGSEQRSSLASHLRPMQVTEALASPVLAPGRTHGTHRRLRLGALRTRHPRYAQATHARTDRAMGEGAWCSSDYEPHVTGARTQRSSARTQYVAFA